MFVAALSIIAKIWKQFKCLSTDDWAKIVYKNCIYLYKKNKNCAYKNI